MSLGESLCLTCNKNDLLLNKFNYCFEKRMKSPKNASNGHENLGCLITDSKMSYVLQLWYQPLWS